jgi:hypothetical protein
MGMYDTIFEKNQYELNDARGRSQRWFNQEVRLMRQTGQISAPRIINSYDGESHLVVDIGDMYLFQYNPKHKDRLPYYDMFPLVIPFSASTDHFVALNFHHLSESMRVYLLEQLYTFKTTPNIDEDTRLLFKWRYLTYYANMSPAYDCVRRYNYANLASSMKKIEPPDWISALLLPLAEYH